MALYNSFTPTFGSFAEVEDWYNKIKPLRGAANAGLDIRPIGDRQRKYERIVKVSDDCYALSEGYHRGDAIFTARRRNAADGEPTLQDMAAFAPIVWRRYGHGEESVTIRNGIGPHMHCARYKFLERNMPKGMSFSIKNGKQFVSLYGTGVDLFLPKGTHLPPAEYAQVVKERQANGGFPKGSMYHQTAWATGTEEKTALVFNKRGSSWELVGGAAAIPTPPRIVVDKEAKALLADKIKAFKDWALIMAPMFKDLTWQVRQEYDKQLEDWLKEAGITGARFWGGLRQRVPTETLREIIADETHPMRVAVAVLFMAETGVHTAPRETKEDVARINATVNTWMNISLGFRKRA